MEYPDESTAPDDLVGQNRVDPIVAALTASGYPVQPGPTQVAPPPPPPAPPVEGPPGAGPGPAAAPAPSPGGPPDAPQGPAPTPPPGPQTGQPPLASGDVRTATQAQNSAISTEQHEKEDAALASANALATHADSKAKIYEGHSTAQGLIDQQYQVAREKARADANAETAVWLRDLDKKVSEKPVPGQWWHSQSTFGKVMWLISLAFGAMAQAKNPNLKNIALEMINKEMDEDIAAQKDRLNRQVEAMKSKGQAIDHHLQAKLADMKDDHALQATRLTMLEQAAAERANAPGTVDMKSAMAEAAAWAGQKRLDIAGERANKAYAERDAQLTRDSEMSRALLTDKRDRDIAAANIQKDYDLARISANVKLSGQDAEKFKDIRVLHPDITGIRVVDATTGAPIKLSVGPPGGLAISTKHEGIEKEVTQGAELAQDRYALLNRVSKALGKDEDLTVLLKRNPQLVSDLQKLGYQQARENDPRGIVTDKDLVSGMESALGGDLSSLSGRIASGTFSAGQGKLKEVVDKAIRDMPAKVSNRFGSLVDAAIPGYEGNVRVDWSPKSVEIDEPGAPSTQKIDASYGIKTPIKAPSNLDELESAQALEKKGLEALPPYKPGSRDKVLKALEDFKGATPETIDARGRAITDKLYQAGDQRAVLEVEQAKYAEMKKAKAQLGEVEDALRILTHTQKTSVGGPRGYLEGEEARVESRLNRKEHNALAEGQVPVGAVVEIAKAHGITQLSGQDVLDIIKKVGLKPYKE